MMSESRVGLASGVVEAVARLGGREFQVDDKELLDSRIFTPRARVQWSDGDHEGQRS